MRNWDLREFRVRVNLPFLIWQEILPIQWAKTPIQRLLNPMRQVVPGFLISARIVHIIPIFIPNISFCIIIAEHKVKSSLSISQCYDHELTLSTAYTEYSIHRVQHTPRTAYTQYCIHRVQHTPCKAYTKYSIHQVQHTPSTAYTKYSIHQVQHTPSTAYTKYSIHPVQHTPSTAYTQYSIHPVQHSPKIVCLPFILMNTS